MRFTYEFEVFPSEGWFLAFPFGLEGGTQGHTMTEVVQMTAEWLEGEAQHALMSGSVLPPPTFGNTPIHPNGRILVVSVEASLDDIEAVSASDAAKLLGVSRPRVSQMLKTGQLIGWNVGRSVFVTRASIEARLAEKPSSGRPRKVSTLSKAVAL